jgi:hypothetical protein
MLGRQLATPRHRIATALFQGFSNSRFVCSLVAPFVTSDASLGSLHCPRRSQTTGPLNLTNEVHPRMKPVPLRVPHCLSGRPAWSAGRAPRVLLPTTASFELAPCEAGRHAHLGSVLRFSQPRNGFLACSNFAALFHAAAIPGIPPSKVSPRENRAPLSGPLCFLVVRHRRARTPPLSLMTAGFHDSHADAQSPASPNNYGLPFHTPESALPGPPGLSDETRSVPSAPPTSKP